MSFGVISLWHCAGFVPKGMTKAICTGVSVEFRLGPWTTYLNARDGQGEADGDIMTVGPLDGEDSIGNEKEGGQGQQGNSKPASCDRFRLNIFSSVSMRVIASWGGVTLTVGVSPRLEGTWQTAGDRLGSQGDRLAKPPADI
jgi:hypothetical protein